MKRLIAFFIFGLVMISNSNLKSQVTHNSKKFLISDYYYPDQKGNYNLYQAQGFAQETTTNTKARLFILPILKRIDDKIEFIDENGLDFNPLVEKTKKAKAILIPVKYSSKLPNKFQFPAIATALENGVNIRYYNNPPRTNQFGQLEIYQPASAMSMQINNAAKPYFDLIEKQNLCVEKYSKYKAELVSLVGLDLSVFIGANEVGTFVYKDTFLANNDQLITVEIENPSLYIQNRIAKGRYKLLASYKFRDAKTSKIAAKFNAKQIIDKFLSESQKSTVSGKSSGWSFLGFSNRRKKIKTSLSSNIEEKNNISTIQETTIEMFDASDDMIDQFESDFFPELSKQRVINNHLEASKDPAISAELRELHLKYAQGLENIDPNLDVDIAGATASLAAGDYAGFIAKGVRVGSNSIKGNSTFRKVISQKAEIDKKVSWNQVRTVSIHHGVTQDIAPIKKRNTGIYHGICGGNQYNYPINSQNSFTGLVTTTMQKGIMLNCVAQNSPAYDAGLLAGMIITDIDGIKVETDQDIKDLFENYDVGDRVDFTIIEYDQFGRHRFKKMPLKLARGIAQ